MGKTVVLRGPEEEKSNLQGFGSVVAKRAPDFSLPNHRGGTFNLTETTNRSAVMLIFYPFDFGMVCTKQLCNYRDNFESFKSYGLEIFGVSTNNPESHAKFAEKYHFQFDLLSDTDREVSSLFRCSSIWLMGTVSRAVFIINKSRIILYKYIEPTVLSRRKAEELVQILDDLKSANLF